MFVFYNSVSNPFSLQVYTTKHHLPKGDFQYLDRKSGQYVLKLSSMVVTWAFHGHLIDFN